MACAAFSRWSDILFEMLFADIDVSISMILFILVCSYFIQYYYLLSFRPIVSSYDAMFDLECFCDSNLDSEASHALEYLCVIGFYVCEEGKRYW